MKTVSKQKLICILVLAVVAAFIAACGAGGQEEEGSSVLEAQRTAFAEDAAARMVEDAPGVTRHDVTETEGDQLIDVSYPTVNENAGISAELEEYANGRIEEFRQVSSSMGAADEESGLYTLMLTYKPYVVGTGLIGFKFTEDSYTLKMDIKDNIETFLFDVSTGNQLRLEDIFDTEQDYLTAVSDTVRDCLSRNAVVQDAMNEDLMRNGTQPSSQNFSNFVITPDNQIVFFFNAGAVTPAEAGPVEVCVALNEFDAVLNPEKRSMLFGREVTEAPPAGEEQPEEEAAQEAAQTDLPQLNLGDNYIPARSIEGIDPINDKVVALTFDDGPGPYTAELLDILKANDAVATFFLIGQNVGNYPELVQRAYDEGHELGSHSWDHPDLAKLTLDQILNDQYGRTNDAIEAIIGKRTSIDRPPYGSMSEELAQQIGREQVLWSVDTNDWREENKDPAIIYREAVDSPYFKDGAIILMHDIHPKTVQAVESIVKELKSRGYKLVTVTQMMQIAEARGNDVAYKFYNAHHTEASSATADAGAEESAAPAETQDSAEE